MVELMNTLGLGVKATHQLTIAGEAWREHFQGGPIAFEQREFELAPPQTDSPFWNVACRADCAVAWNPSLRGGAKIEETYLVRNDSVELITNSGEWAMSSDAVTQHSQVKVVQ